jgi:hypothetical protein
MRFEIIMNMPTRGGIDKISEPVHRLVVDHPSKSLEEFVHVLMNYDFVIVDEFYPDPVTKAYKSHGLIALNHRYVGKIKQWDRKQ